MKWQVAQRREEGSFGKERGKFSKKIGGDMALGYHA